MTTENLKRCKSVGIDQITAELIQAGGRTVRSEIHKLFDSICNKKEGVNHCIYLQGLC
jgi:hypothetical protein